MRAARVFFGAVLLVACAGSAGAQDKAALPAGIAWAYPASPEKTPFPELPAATEYRVQGSSLVYTGDQLNKMADPVDWWPSLHPPMPPIVAHADHDRKLEACSGCHGIIGQGAIEIPNLAGLPAGYIAEQLHEFAAGRRHSSGPARDASVLMEGFAGKLSESEIADAAKFFASITKRPRWVQVIEADSAPVTKASFYGWLELVPGGGTEPLGRRVIEVAENFDQMWIGDPNSGLIAYVPPGALERGKALVHQGAQRCVSCHGANLKGIGKAPSLAGRDPHYLARALWDIKSGSRNGPAVALMQKPAASLTEDQIVDVVAYLASLAP